MLKHLKTRDTGLLYELLVGHLISEVRVNKTPKALYIIKEFFSKGSELYKDLQIYTHLVEMIPTKKIDTHFLIKEIVDSDPVDVVKLKEEVYLLCGSIRKEYGDLNSFFNASISKYKLFASIYQLLEFYRNGYSDPKSIEQRMLCENYIEGMIRKRMPEVKNNKLVLGDFGQSILLEKFINRYRNKLSKEQFNIVYSYMRGDEKIVDSSFKAIAKSLNECLIKLPKETKIKVGECIKKLQNVKKVSNESDLKLLIYSRGLLEELQGLE